MKITSTVLLICAAALLVSCRTYPGIGSEMTNLASGFKFTEGPACSATGDIFFTDIPNSRIHVWSQKKGLWTFRENSGKANGLLFNGDNALYICEGGNRRVTSISAAGELKILADRFEGKKFNSPNDLWIDPKGGIYFTDPRYGNRDNMEMGEHVYYLATGGDEIIRVIDDMVRPNGVVGTPDGKTLYVTDNADRKTFKYSINSDGTLADKKLLAPEGSDGMALDGDGNLYITTDAVKVYSPSGKLLKVIKVPEHPSNVCFGADKKTLFITARTSLYAVCPYK